MSSGAIPLLPQYAFMALVLSESTGATLSFYCIVFIIWPALKTNPSPKSGMPKLCNAKRSLLQLTDSVFK
jgi:hypothetical protein